MLQEHLIIWPKAYFSLLRGLLEGNSVYVLDALEAWPRLTVDVQQAADHQIISYHLSPQALLLWLHPEHDPCMRRHIQHIHEFTDTELQQLLQWSQAVDHHALLSHSWPVLQQHTAFDDKAVHELLVCQMFEQGLASLWRDWLAMGGCMTVAQAEHCYQLDSSAISAISTASALHDDLSSAFAAQLAQGSLNGEFWQALLNQQHAAALKARLRSSLAKTTLTVEQLRTALPMLLPLQLGEETALADLNLLPQILTVVSKAQLPLACDDWPAFSDAQGETLLHYLVRAQRPDLLVTAVKLGCDVGQTDARGVSAYSLADELGQTETLRVFKQQLHYRQLSDRQWQLWHSHQAMLACVIVVAVIGQWFWLLASDVPAKEWTIVSLFVATLTISLWRWRRGLSIKRMLKPQLAKQAADAISAEPSLDVGESDADAPVLDEPTADAPKVDKAQCDVETTAEHNLLRKTSAVSSIAVPWSWRLLAGLSYTALLLSLLLMALAMLALLGTGQ